jgi:hypothetical protein
MDNDSDDFGKNELGISFIHEWAKKRIQKQKDIKANKDELEYLFGQIIIDISSSRKKIGKIINKANIECDNNNSEKALYSEDASLFELVCYSFVQTNIWLQLYNSNRHLEVMEYIFTRATDFFYFVFDDEKIYKIIQNRFRAYKKIYENEESNLLEDELNLISKFILWAKYNGFPKIFESEIPYPKMINMNQPREVLLLAFNVELFDHVIATRSKNFDLMQRVFGKIKS